MNKFMNYERGMTARDSSGKPTGVRLAHRGLVTDSPAQMPREGAATFFCIVW
jgi:hypothetical protein